MVCVSLRKMYKLFGHAFKGFLAKDASSIRDNVSERHLCARLGIQFELLLMQYNLQAYYADVEYNRKQDGKIKTVLLGPIEVIAITCDLILHSRGEQQRDNLIAIEMAKPDKTVEQIRSDRLRLMALTKRNFDKVWSTDGIIHPKHVCDYVLGAFIMIDGPKKRVVVEFFEDGEAMPEKRTYSLSGA